MHTGTQPVPTKKCRNCGAPNNVSAQMCKHCGGRA